MLILVVWLHGTLVLAERRSGCVIILLGSLLGSGMPVIHTTGTGIAKSSGAFSVWTLLALGVTAIFSLILSAATSEIRTSRSFHQIQTDDIGLLMEGSSLQSLPLR